MPADFDPASLPTELTELAFKALDHAYESVEASGGPLVPFAMVETDGSIALTRFAGDLEKGHDEARALVRGSTDAERGAVAWDGYVTHGGKRADAVMTQASELPSGASVLMAQRYEVKGRIRKQVIRLGNPVLIGAGVPLS